MSRSSDTRQCTREAAAQLVADGKRPHEITVDLIYAAIRQGSRTTINDALKAWRDERTWSSLASVANFARQRPNSLQLMNVHVPPRRDWIVR